MISRINITASRAIDCRGQIDLPFSVVSVWGQLRDFPRFAARDPFHHNPSVKDGLPRAGVKISLIHRYAGIQIRRTGKILIWRENLGYSFSDLSFNGPKCGFPHVFSYRLEPLAPKSTRLHISVRGRWTARGIPRVAVRLYLLWVFGQTVSRVRNEFLIYQLWRKRFHAP